MSDKLFLSEEQRGKFEKRMTIAYFLSMFVLGMGGSVYGPIIADLSEATGATQGQVSNLFLFLGAGFIFTTLVLCKLFDRLPGNILIAIGIVGLAFMIPQLSYVNAPWQLFMVVTLMGLFNGLVDSGANTLIPWLLGERCKPAFNIIHVCYSFGALLTPWMISFSIRKSIPIRSVFHVIFVLLILASIYVISLPSPQIPHKTDDIHEDVNQNHRYVTMVVAVFGMAMLCACANQHTFNNWVTTVTRSIGLTDEAGAVIASTIFWCGIFCGRFTGTFLSTKVPGQKLVMSCFTILCCSSLLLPLSKTALLPFFILIFVDGFAIGPLIANIMLLVNSKIYVSGQITGILFTFKEIACTVIPWGYGLLAVGERVFPLFVGSAILYAFVGLGLLLYARKL